MFSFEKERQRPCARVSADDGADIIYGDLVSGEFLMDQSDKVFDVLEAIPVTDENRIPLFQRLQLFHIFDERLHRFFPAHGFGNGN